jgi:hypothetical protein
MKSRLLNWTRLLPGAERIAKSAAIARNGTTARCTNFTALRGGRRAKSSQ